MRAEDDRDHARPGFAIRLGDRALDPAVADEVIEIEVVTRLRELARATVRFRSPELLTGAPAGEDASGAARLALGLPLAISLGHGDERVEVFDGLVTGWRTDFDPGEPPVLEVAGRCRGVLLTGSPQHRVWSDRSDAQVVAQICAAAGLRTNAASGPIQPALVQYRCSDWEYLRARADALGAALHVRGDEVSFAAARTDVPPARALTWGDELLELHLEHAGAGVLTSATLRAWDPEQKEVVSARCSTADPGLAPGGRPTTALAPGAPVRDLVAAVPTPLQQDELAAAARSLAGGRALVRVQGSGRCVGAPALRVDAVLELIGLGDTADGRHYVTGVSHHLTPGRFETRFALGAAPKPRSAHEEEPRSFRTLPRAEGLVLARVVSCADTGSEQARVQIELPWFAEGAPPIWARLAAPGAGAGRGIVWVPEPDDEVVVQFLDGDPRFPVVLGSLWNGVDAPPDSYDPERNARRSFVSRAGHKVVLDDSDDAPQVLVESSAGQRVLLDDRSGAEQVRLEDKTGNQLVLDSAGISLSAASGKTIALSASGGAIELSANEVRVQADTTVSVAGGSSVELMGQARLRLEGADVAVDGRATVSVQAPMIKLN